MTASERSVRAGLSIGAVLEQLRPEFPDVTISKIRFLESEGLVRPARTDAGYRQFTPADVQRLRMVLATQRDHYLPLKIIKEQLDAGEPLSGLASEPTSLSGLRPHRLSDAVSSEQGTPALSVAGVLGSFGDGAMSREERIAKDDFLTEANIDESTLRELEQYGLVRPDAVGFYDHDALVVARTAKAMTHFGIEPRHLRAFRTAADREVGLIEQITAPLRQHRDPSTRARADKITQELAALSVALHTALVKAGLWRGHS